MDETLSKQRFNEQTKLLLSRTQAIKDHDWGIEVVYPDIFCKIHPKRHQDKIFMIRLRCNDYPARSPSLQLVDPTTKNEGKQYWPQQGDAFKAALSRSGIQLCIPGIREYHEGCHANPNDSNPWNPEKYAFADVLERVQNLLDEAYP